MIIRRKHNGNFTVIPNAILNDDRLNYDAVGLLCYLLSKPDNWQVKVNQLRRRGGIGRDKTYKLINELCDMGYINKQSVRDPDTKAFASHEFVVSDQPFPENTELAELGIENEPLPEKPYPEKPYPANQDHNKYCKVTSTESNKAPSDEAAKLETGFPSKPKKRISYTPEFDIFWKAYPTTPNMPKANAFKEWKRLDATDRQVATASLPAYRKHLAKENWLKAVYAERYLKQRRFDGYADSGDDVDWAKCCDLAIRTGQWSRLFGPLPGQPGCKVPPELVTPELISAVNDRGVAA